MDEHVLKGNSAILKCHIPSFVSDFVNIDAWIDDETGEEFRIMAGENLGREAFELSKFNLISPNKFRFCFYQLTNPQTLKSLTFWF